MIADAWLSSLEVPNSVNLALVINEQSGGYAKRSESGASWMRFKIKGPKH